MPIRIGEVAALFRYPVKSMAGERVEAVDLGWHGLDGDRRLALRRAGDRNGFPWLTASSLPELILYTPLRRETSTQGNLPSHVRTPEGRELPLFSDELAADVAQRHGAPLEMMHLNRGIFDEASVSVISSTTADAITQLASRPPDIRRFRPNIVLSSVRAIPFEEDEWVRGVLTFGEGPDAPVITVTNRDERCAMVNFDPDSARTDANVLRAIVRQRNNKLGVYGATTRCGRLAAGQSVFFERA